MFPTGHNSGLEPMGFRFPHISMNRPLFVSPSNLQVQVNATDSEQAQQPDPASRA